MDTSPAPSDPLHRLQPPVQLGDRLTVRRRLPDGSATDVIGFLERIDATALTVITVDQHSEVIDRTMIIAARRVPPARGGRDPITVHAEVLQTIAAASWLDHSEPLGDWLLRSADGFTRRANSVLAVGDPGRPRRAAAAAVIDFYRRRRLPPLAQVVAGSENDHGLRSLGWSDGGPDTVMMVSRLGSLIEQLSAAQTSRVVTDGPSVQVADQPSSDWWRALLAQRGMDTDALPGADHAMTRVISGRPPAAFATIGSPPQAIGRGQLSRDWLGLAAMWTDPALRRSGRAVMIIDALARWAARHGGRHAYLQVEAANAPALALYERLGFVHHHDYSYLAPPG